MKKTLGIIAAIIIIIIAIVIVNQGKRPETENLKIGVIATLTGDFAGVGENLVKGIKTAQALHEEKTGDRVELVIENDGGDGAKGLSAFRKLTTTDQVNGLINTFTTTMDSIYEPSKEVGYPIMMEAFQANNVGDDHVFQMTLGNDHVWDRYAKYISGSGFDESKVVIVHSQDAAQDSFAKAFTAAYQKPVTTLIASTDKNGLRADAAKIGALKPTVLIVLMTPENGAILTKEVLPLISTSTQLVYDIQLYTGLSFYQAQLGGDLSKINGAINIMFEGDPNSAEYKEFLAAFKKLYPNEEPGFLADYGYDTFVTYINAYDKDEARWTENLKETNFAGASGDVMFDENGIRIPALVVKKVVNGKSETVDRLPF